MAVVVKVWSLDQLQRYNLGSCYECQLSGSNKMRNWRKVPVVQFIWFNKSFKVIVIKTKFENHCSTE